MLSMPSDTLSVLGEKILLAIWKSNAIGIRSVGEDALKSDISDSSNGFSQELKTLLNLGFITRGSNGGGSEFALTPLGLAILRQIEEDKLQELR
jgi:DNA-binding HxlR family transcriptional regulator